MLCVFLLRGKGLRVFVFAEGRNRLQGHQGKFVGSWPANSNSKPRNP